MIKLKRIYDAASMNDGYRILVDRLWPRGISKQRAQIDLWMKSIAPSTELRVWFGHKPERFAKFQTAYWGELSRNPEVETLQEQITKHDIVTLLYGAKDPDINHAVVLKQYISQHLEK